MPSYHSWKCLNDNCGAKFDAWDKPMPECTECGCTKVEDGRHFSIPASFGKPGAAKRIDGTLNHLADTHGLTNINNHGGAAAKGYVAPTDGRISTLNVAGMEVPVHDRPTAVWGQPAGKSFSVPTNKGKIFSSPEIPTQVVASHKSVA